MTKEELKLHIENRYSVCSKRTQGLSYGSFYDGYMDCYSELEEKLANADYQLEGRDNEIAELKALIDNDVDKKIYVQLAKKAKLADVQKVQLTKAKDFILKLTTYLEGHTNYDFEYELIKEVKQFLKESEVEK